MESETLVATPDTSPADSEAPVLQDTAEEPTPGEDTGESQEDTQPEYLTPEREQAIREEARKTALAEVEEQQSIKALQQRVQQSEAWLQQRGVAEIKDIVKHFVNEVESGRKTGAEALNELNDAYLQRGAAARMASAVMTEQLALARGVNESWVRERFPEWRIPTDLIKRRDLAAARLDTAELLRVENEIILRAAEENVVPKKAETLAKDIAAKNQKASEVAETRKRDADRASADRPTTTTGGGTGGVGITSFNDAAAAYNKGQITGTQYASYAKQFGVPID